MRSDQKKRSPLWIACCLVATFIPSVFAEGSPPEEMPLCEEGMCIVPATEKQPGAGLPDAGDAPRSISPKKERMMWAAPRLYTEAPPIEVSSWIGAPPDMEGKFVVIEFWRSWCSACKKAVPKLNRFREKYKDDVVVIAMTGESEQTVLENYNGPEMKYPIALDTLSETSEQRDQGVYEEKFGVWGWPHVIILEPQDGVVIWEGYCDLAGYELTDEIMDRIVAIGRNQKKSDQ